MIHAFSRLPHSLPHFPFPTFPLFLCLKIVEIDLVNGFVNCANYANMYVLYVQMKYFVARTYIKTLTLIDA